MQIPIYEAGMPDEWYGGIDCISLVERPAMEVGFSKFSNQNPTPMIRFDKECQSVVGALVVPDKLIYRVDEWTGEEYYVRFGKEVIRKMRDKMMAEGKNMQFNLEHTIGTEQLWQVQCQEVWIKESDRDKSVDYGFDLPNGTLFMMAKINDIALWERVKNGEFNGFSIEAWNNFTYAYMTEKILFSSLEVGNPIMVRNKEGKIENYSGSTELEGKEVTAENGLITEVKEKEEPKEPTTPAQAQEPVVEEPKEPEENKELEEVKTELSAIKEMLNQVTSSLQQFSSVNKEIEAINERIALQNLAFKQANQPEVKDEPKEEKFTSNRLETINALKRFN